MLRVLSLLSLAAAALAVGPVVANAQGTAADLPNHPMRIIVPFAPGGSTDVMARMIAEGLSTRLHQQAVVENKAGAGGIVAAVPQPGALAHDPVKIGVGRIVGLDEILARQCVHHALGIVDIHLTAI